MKNTHSLEGNTELIAGDHWQSQHGIVKILHHCRDEIHGFPSVRVRFLDTGGIRVIRNALIKNMRYCDLEVSKPRVKGTIRESDDCGKFIVQSELDRDTPIGHQKVWIKFFDTGGVRLAHWPNVHRGDIKDLDKPSYAGIGYTGYGKYKRTGTTAGSLWEGILRRTVADYSYNHRNKSYHDKGIHICEHWHNFQNFAGWYYEELNHGKKGWQLDKDMKVFGAKEYSPETCSFLPFELNNFLFFDHSAKGYERRGVFRNKGEWQAQSGQLKQKGFKTSKDAFMWYKEQKETEALRLANKWDGIVDPQVIHNLRTLDIKPIFPNKEDK